MFALLYPSFSFLRSSCSHALIVEVFNVELMGIGSIANKTKSPTTTLTLRRP